MQESAGTSIEDKRLERASRIARTNEIKQQRRTILRVLVHIGGWVPLAHLLYSYFADELTANPIQAIEQRTGLYALTFLVISLAITPLAAISGWKDLTLRRKALGNYGFMYALCHVFTFFVIDYGLDLLAVWRDVWNKYYIIIGATAFVLLLPLAVTSFDYWQKRLGKNWKRLHKLVYIISPLVVVHFLLAVKGNISQLRGDISQPLLYGTIVAILLLLRVTPIKLALVKLRGQVMERIRGAG